ncbi:hypothetical protein [Paracoccus yeei]|uniref:hypothetical protein n=1 Tax=Paracoccus yeei TaxID=147645 RepID=UPI00048AB7BF|nr:hypothetical protein [Paracoccus yeei]OWJ95290.1 hypothetical protein CDV54_07860 [Paracoccus yeei]
MTMKQTKAESFDVLAHQEEYARASAGGEDADHVANLQFLRDQLLRKRRFLAQDAVTYPITYMGRALDVARLQPVIDMLDRAIEEERGLAARAGK